MDKPSMKNDDRISLELLAPAGTADIGMAAIDHGADAVYIGAPRFSARANAGNSMEDISRLIEYAHLFHARVYLALNTILTATEMDEALPIIRAVHEAGADGLIIQDTGLLEPDLPPIPLIASTQMHNDCPEKVKFLEDAGFTRAILARELSLDEIRNIRSRTTIELESFVHGAICVCYSGQCYLSQAAFGRSGNRGVCAQPCRLTYTLKDGKGKSVITDKHLLSPRDLNLIDHLNDLAEAGITSFKIEGRYKDAAYVKNVTAAYRLALDRVIASHPRFKAQSSGRVHLQFTPDLHKTFNRGYTGYFLHDVNEKSRMAALDTPKSVGAEVGTITAVGKNEFTMKGDALHNGDGMCFFTRSGDLKGFRVDRAENRRIFPNTMEGLHAGLTLFRNHDHAFMARLEKPSAERKIAVDMVFDQTESDIHLTVTDEDGHTVKASLDTPYERAKQPEKIKDQIKTQLVKTGQTPFEVRHFSLLTPDPGFLQVSLLNSLRRQALDRLCELRLKSHAVRPRMEPAGPAPEYPEKQVDYKTNILNPSARAFYEKHGAKVTEEALEAGTPSSGKVLMTTRYCIRREIGACLKHPKPLLTIDPPLSISDGKRTYRLEFDCRKCRMHVISGQ